MTPFGSTLQSVESSIAEHEPLQKAALEDLRHQGTTGQQVMDDDVGDYDSDDDFMN